MEFNVIEAIKERRSVRTYEEQPLDPEMRRKIEEFIPTLTNPLGDTTVRIAMVDKKPSAKAEKLGTYGVIKDATTFLGLMCGKSETDVLAAGYEFEKLILYATSLQLGTVWLGVTFAHKPFARAMHITRKEQFAAISPVGIPAKKRMLEKLMRTIVRSDTRKPWNELFFDNNFSTPLTAEHAADFGEALEMVRLAPSANNTQPWRIVKTGDKFHLFAALREKPIDEELMLRHLDMGIAMCHFDLAAQSAGLHGAFIHENPDIADTPSTYRYIISWRPI